MQTKTSYPHLRTSYPCLRTFPTQVFLVFEGKLTVAVTRHGKKYPARYLHFTSLREDLGWVEVPKSVGDSFVSAAVNSEQLLSQQFNPGWAYAVSKPTIYTMREPLVFVFSSKRTTGAGVQCEGRFLTVEDLDREVHFDGLEVPCSIERVRMLVKHFSKRSQSA
jgi:hypothetical protein